MTKAKKIYGWHFVNATLRDGSPIPPDGEWLEYKGVCKMCASGLHFSDTPAMALEYAPGATLCYVELENVVDRQADKGVCTRRKIIAKMDATEVLYYFARMQALSVSHLWAENDDAGDIVLDWLLTGDDAAWDAAWDAARDAAWAVAWDAARDAARAAAWDAARDADRAAAGDATRAAAWDIAWAVAWDADRAADRAAAWDAAWNVARDADRAAAGDATRAAAWDAFNELVYECFEEVLQ